MTTVGIVGLGLLGSAIASRFIKAGHAVVGFDILPARVAALTAMGGKAAPSAAAVAQSAEAVCTLLPSLAAAETAVLGRDGILAGARPGLTVLQMSTISPALTERLAREVAGRGLGFLDCPVSGTTSMIERGDGSFFVGGKRALYERWRPVLESALPRVVLVGRVGQAMTLKLVANLLVALHSAAAAEALTLARKAGLDLDVALEVLNSSAATSAMLKVRGPMILRGEFPAQMKLDLFMKDLHLMQEAAAAVGAPLPFTDLAERLYAAAQAAGHGGEDLAVVVTALEQRAARTRKGAGAGAIGRGTKSAAKNRKGRQRSGRRIRRAR
jgi:3-hydroxyisobutyrate dehydrogenase-like beta-hydroxyacid dehydrogenase